MDIGIQLLVVLGILLLVVFIGTPISFGLGFVAITSILILLAPSQLTQIANVVFDQGTSMNQLVAPMFILMAEVLAQGKIAADIFSVLSKWTRKLRGGLAISATLASTIFAALCGSSPATAAAIGRISISEMVSRKYKPSFAAGTVAAGGTLGIMIPPSMALIIYGIITENSIAKLFVAGLLPGLFISAMLIVFILIVGLISPATVGASKEQRREQTDSVAPTTFLQDIGIILPPLILIAIILGSIYKGLATPTEASGIGAVGSIILLIAQRRFSWSLAKSILTRAARTSSMIICLIFGGMTLSYVVSYLGIAQAMADMIIGLGVNKYLLMCCIYLLWFALGCLIDPLSMIILTIPFMYPTLTALGFDPLWLAVVSTLAVEMGMITPPVGLNLFVIKGISTVPMGQIIRGVLPFMAVLLFCLAVLTIFPKIALYLPNHM
jgi:tripartite ATP-independent transporter DctM subunit